MVFKILQQNITKLEVDLIVSPDDKRLSHSKGVSWQIAQVAGEGRVARFVRKYTPLNDGQGVLSDGFNLSASSILHLVIPQEGCVGFEQKLRDAYGTLFRLVKEKECKSVALPLLGEGVLHMQKDHLMEIALCSIQEYLFENKNTDIFLCFSNRDVDRISYRLYEDLILYLDDYLITNVSLYDSLGSRIFISEDRQHIPSTQASLEFLRIIEKRMEEKQLSKVELCSKSNLSVNSLSKLYDESKDWGNKAHVLAVLIALEYSLDEAEKLLQSLNYSFDSTSKQEMTISYFLSIECYSVIYLNHCLYELGEEQLV